MTTDRATRSSELYQQGRAFLDAGETQKAITVLEESAAILPHFKALEILGECQLNQGQHGRAIISLAASAALGTKPYKSWYLLSKALMALGEIEQAREALERALTLNPDYRKAAILQKELSSQTGR
jgi:tetratricopeptide (TPR) repeat protein